MVIVAWWQVPEVIRCLANTIIFNRAFGPLVPLEAESELFDVVYPRCGLEEVNRKIDDQIPKLMASLVPVAPDLARGQLSILFFEKRVSKGFLGIASSTEKVNWEQWQIRIVVNKESHHDVRTEEAVIARARKQATLEKSLRDCMLQILVEASSKTSHIPPVNFNIDTPVLFPFEIICTGHEAASSWIPRFLKAGPPLLG